MLSLHTILVGGFFGLLPDIDVVLEIVFFSLFGTIWGVHRAFTHTLIIPLLLAVLSFIFWKNKKIFFLGLVAAFGWATHVILDFLLVGEVPLLFPLTTASWGLNLLVSPTSPLEAGIYLLAALDAVVFLAWIWHEEKYKKIKDFL